MTIDSVPTGSTAPAEPPFTILVVCTGNICRSPLAEQLLAARLTAAGVPARVLSAGTYAMVGEGMPDEAAALSIHYGGHPEAHHARQLTAKLVADADLVVTAAREHRSEVVSLHPRASRYAFTLNQLARLTAGLAEAEQAAAVHAAAERTRTDAAAPTAAHAVSLVDAAANPASTLRAYIAEVAASRGLTPPPAAPADDDIEDPYRRSQATYDRVGVAIDAAVRTIATALAGSLGMRV
ncbi:low molecular weight phosphatase family protein [Cryobacterium sp. GrIS_2_6]|uniref:arsenate reductase/protein-tyrosine-phosphatase family protein n=1 Tax=Cryobacterium sp. GrIS_2_6 TaxID=3162785 RepID=UPI002E0CE8AE|nr:protein-tyrosine phosphatase [Cryobacterium psychrotolerans]